MTVRPDAGQWPHERPDLVRAAVWACPDQATFEALVASRDLASPPAAGWDKDPKTDPAGLALYDKAVDRISRKARIIPLLFDQVPPAGPEQAAFLSSDKRAAAEFVAIWSARGHKQWAAIRKARNKYGDDKQRLRHLVLRDGYGWSDHPAVARYMWRGLSLSHLFDEPSVHLARGSRISRLERDADGDYRYVDGPRQGARARLSVFDRVAIDPATFDRRHAWDLDAFRRAAGLHTLLVEEHTRDLLLATARQRDGTELQAAALRVDAERRLVLLIEPDSADAVHAQLARDARREAMLEGLTLAAELMADEQLRFDEPRTEIGQQDGALRRAWKRAYAKGERFYTFNDDRYPVFTRHGKPKPPQVCIDFVIDVPERWSGSWWTDKGTPPTRTKGFLDLSRLDFNRRKVSALLAFARDNPDILDLHTVPPKRRVAFELTTAFYRFVESLSARTEPGDTLVIFGLRSDERNHWHAFNVYATDPMRGVPYLLAGNAGTANVQVWDDVMKSAPLRSIRYRVRFRPEWLEAQHRLASPR